MTTAQLYAQIQKKQSFLCVGLDVDLDKVPAIIRDSPHALVDFSKAIIDATAPYAVAFKPNIAFFETYGVQGMAALETVTRYVHDHYPEIFTIADAKRGDIGNTSTRYAKAYFDTLGFDALTVAPYMGRDSVEPFLAFPDKHTILLALTSNPGSNDFQQLNYNGTSLYEHVLLQSQQWEGSDRLMFVVGATHAQAIAHIRNLVPDSFLLVPGVGAQGGSLQDVARAGLNRHAGLLVNSSRAILYASQGEDFAKAAAQVAQNMQAEMKGLLLEKKLI